MKDRTRKEMQRKMADCRISAPEVSWAEIEQAVGARPRGAAFPLRRRLTAAAAAVALLLAGGAGLGLLLRPQATEPFDLVPGAVREALAMVEIAPETASRPTAGADLFSAGGVSPADDCIAGPSDETGPGPDDLADRSQPSDPPTENAPDPGTTVPENAVPESPSRLPEDSRNLWAADWPGPARAAGRSRSGGGARLTAFMGSAMSGYSGASSFSPMLMSAPPIGVYDEEMAGENPVPLQGGYGDLGSDVRHRQPVRFGLALRYGFGDRWSVESGLAVSVQHSEFTGRAGVAATEQHLVYVGIPLNAGCRLWSGGGFDVYASAGGMVEKMVKGSRAAEPVRIRPLQFSLTGAVGAEYRIAESLSLYAEPGLAYHFDSGTAVPCIYRDAPLNFNLNVGLRFAFD